MSYIEKEEGGEVSRGEGEREVSRERGREK